MILERHKQSLVMRVPIVAKLKTSLREVSDTLNGYPHFKLIRRGSTLKYALEIRSKLGSTYCLEFSRTGVILEVLSKDSPLYDMRSALNISMGTCAMLKDHYDVRFDSIYPYIAYELNKEAVENHCSRSAKYTVRNYSDIILAKRINELLKRNEELEMKALKAQSSLNEVASGILIFEGLNRIAVFSETSLRYGIDGQQLEEAIARVGSRGYRLTRLDKGRFSVVSI